MHCKVPVTANSCMPMYAARGSHTSLDSLTNLYSLRVMVGMKALEYCFEGTNTLISTWLVVQVMVVVASCMIPLH